MVRGGEAKFEEFGSFVDLKFERRKNSQFKQGNTVTVSATSHGVVCLVRLLKDLQRFVGSNPASYVFQGFNGRLVAKSPHKKCYMERDREAILSVSRAAMGQRGPAPSMVPQTPPRGDIRLESGDIIEELEGDAEVAPDIEDLPFGAFRRSESLD